MTQNCDLLEVQKPEHKFRLSRVELSVFLAEQLINIKQMTLSGVFCKTLDDQDQLRFQRNVFLQPAARAFHNLRQDSNPAKTNRTVLKAPNKLSNFKYFFYRKQGLSSYALKEKMELYNGDPNERVSCANLPSLDFSLF